MSEEYFIQIQSPMSIDLPPWQSADPRVRNKKLADELTGIASQLISLSNTLREPE